VTRAELPLDGGYFVVPKTIGWSMVASAAGIIVGGVWFLAVQVSRLEQVERDVTASRVRIEELNRERDRWVKLESQMGFAIDTLRRIDERLAKLGRE
jgi:hypothetical protein